MYLKSLLIEATVVGVSVLVFALIVFLINFTILHYVKKYDKTNTDFLKSLSHFMLITVLSLFLTGFLLHITFEYVGLNRWYVKNSVAAKKLKK